MTPIQAAILRELKATGRPLTIKQLAALTGHPKDQVETTADELAEYGELLVTKAGRDTRCQLPTGGPR